MWVPNFTGYAISETSLPPPGTVLSAKTMLPVWSEPVGRRRAGLVFVSASTVARTPL